MLAAERDALAERAIARERIEFLHREAALLQHLDHRFANQAGRTDDCHTPLFAHRRPLGGLKLSVYAHYLNRCLSIRYGSSLQQGNSAAKSARADQLRRVMSGVGDETSAFCARWRR